MNTLCDFTCTHANVIALFFPFLDFEHTMQYLVCKNYLWDGQNSAVGREKNLSNYRPTDCYLKKRRIYELSISLLR